MKEIVVTKLHPLATLPSMFYQDDVGHDLSICKSVVISEGIGGEAPLGLF